MIDLPVLLVRTGSGRKTARPAAGKPRFASFERIPLPSRPGSRSYGALTWNAWESSTLASPCYRCSPHDARGGHGPNVPIHSSSKDRAILW